MFIPCLLRWIQKHSAESKTAIHHSKTFFNNGYAFDKLFPDVIASSIDCAIDAGTSVFLEHGTRGRSLLHGNLDEQEHALRLSHVVPLTSDEVTLPSYICSTFFSYYSMHNC